MGVTFPPANNPGGFRVAAFIDNKVIATSRPGGGPTVAGERHDPLIQRAFYNGWYKISNLV